MNGAVTTNAASFRLHDLHSKPSLDNPLPYNTLSVLTFLRGKDTKPTKIFRLTIF